MFHHIWRWEPVFEASSEEQLWEDFQQLCHSQFQSKASQEIKTRSNFQNTLQELGADVSRVAFFAEIQFYLSQISCVIKSIKSF